MNIAQAKERLDLIIRKSRVDMYKPIQVAEALRHSRLDRIIDFKNIDSYKNPSLQWRNIVSRRLLGKISTSSAQFQHNIWNENAFPSSVMIALDDENRNRNGIVENYIYKQLSDRLATVSSIIAYIRTSTVSTFSLPDLLEHFTAEAGMRRSIDKAYEIVTHSLFETVVVALKAQVSVTVPKERIEILKEFERLASMLLGVSPKSPSFMQSAHIYRVGVTNAADRGLDMWANFGPAVQVKHLTLNSSLASSIVDQVESDHVVVVCKACEKDVITTVMGQIGWGRRVRGVVTELDLIDWYEKCLRGKFSHELGQALIIALLAGFEAEFTQDSEVAQFLEERGYVSSLSGIWGSI